MERRTELPIQSISDSKVSENNSRLISLYKSVPDVFYKTIISLNKNDILNLCKTKEFKDLCKTKEFWQRLWRAEFKSQLPTTNDMERAFFRRRAITRLIKELMKGKDFRQLNWVQDKSEKELIHLIDILPILPDNNERFRIYNDLLKYIIKNNDIEAFDALVDERTPAIHNIFDSIVSSINKAMILPTSQATRVKMLEIIMERLTPSNLKLSISGIQPYEIYEALSAETPCNPIFDKRILPIVTLDEDDKHRILKVAAENKCDKMVDKLIDKVPINKRQYALLQAVKNNDINMINKIWVSGIDTNYVLDFVKSLDVVKLLYSKDKNLDVTPILITSAEEGDPELFEFILPKIRDIDSDNIYNVLNSILTSKLNTKEKRRRFILFIDRLFEIKIRNIVSKSVSSLLKVSEEHNKDYGIFYLESILNRLTSAKEINMIKYIEFAERNNFQDSLEILLNFAKKYNINLKELSPKLNSYSPKFREKLLNYIKNYRISP